MRRRCRSWSHRLPRTNEGEGAPRSLLALFLVLGAPCSSSAPDDVEGSPGSGFRAGDALQADGPLRVIGFTGHVNEAKTVVEPTLSFSTNDLEATAVVDLGDLPERSTLTVTWYRVIGLEKRESLSSD